MNDKLSSRDILLRINEQLNILIKSVDALAVTTGPTRTRTKKSKAPVDERKPKKPTLYFSYIHQRADYLKERFAEFKKMGEHQRRDFLSRHTTEYKDENDRLAIIDKVSKLSSQAFNGWYWKNFVKTKKVPQSEIEKYEEIKDDVAKKLEKYNIDLEKYNKLLREEQAKHAANELNLSDQQHQPEVHFSNPTGPDGQLTPVRNNRRAAVKIRQRRQASKPAPMNRTKEAAAGVFSEFAGNDRFVMQQAGENPESL